MRIDDNNCNNCSNNSKIDYSELDKKILENIEAEAEKKKQEQILNGRIEQMKNKKLAELVELETQRDLYGLNDKQEIKVVVDKNECKQCETQCEIERVYKEEKKNFKNGFAKGKEKIMMVIALIIMLVLAVGITPSGAWFDLIQESWVELIVDFFRMGMLGLGGYFIYKLFKDKE